MNSVGICVDASTLKLVAIDEQGHVRTSIVKKHDCDLRNAFGGLLASFRIDDYTYLAVTGRRFKESLNLASVTEVEAIEYALKNFLRAEPGLYNGVISLESETFILYELDGHGNIVNVHSGTKCGAGTGEFFRQQVQRMNIEVDEAIRLAQGAVPYHVSGRCSVFCKSDCTHALNSGVPIDRISAGLGEMMAEKILELFRFVKKENIVAIGDLTANSYVMERLRGKITNLIIPDQAETFTALGAALYAWDQKKTPPPTVTIAEHPGYCGVLPKLADARHLVSFREQLTATAQPGDHCILGLDAGSTTTKAVLMRTEDAAIIASVYLRTNGNPVAAARNCYTDIYRQLEGTPVVIHGLAVTGSGRQIVGLHALSNGIVNEIIAHAAGAAMYDGSVDTIIEIGGQDAKYTHLVNGVPCDYAMNEACSAGTGSFLEEAAKESLNIDYREIQDLAFQGDRPPNFNDQCSAFISSDIKNAMHGNIGIPNIVAGLVYAVCMNYDNRVKGSRKLGETIFMQGGVCYNRAVPVAMAVLLNKKIIVPGDPGLVGAYGAALEVKDRIAKGLMQPSSFDLRELAVREATYGMSFVCRGAPEGCDLGCKINLIQIQARQYPFGGMCNKYYNIRRHTMIHPGPLDIVAMRNNLVFSKKGYSGNKTVGILKSFFVNSLFPLYYTFFSELGLDVILGNRIDPDGVKMAASSFCFPAETAHGMFEALLNQNPDYIFLPQVVELFEEQSSKEGKGLHCSCVLAQSEPYYLRSAFRKIQPELVSPVLDFSQGWESMEEEFLEVGARIGAGKARAKKAYHKACEVERKIEEEKKRLGDHVLAELEGDMANIAIVIFGRSYNAFADETNLGIPRKFASRGIPVIPYDCLRFGGEESMENMNWASGHEIVKAARFVKRHP